MDGHNLAQQGVHQTDKLDRDAINQLASAVN